jgi:Na+-translocating ferredoxin:NAD+ oxidoreductase RnfG subunit
MTGSISLKTIYHILFAGLIIFAISLHQNSLFGWKIRGEEIHETIDLSLEQAQNIFKNAAVIKKQKQAFRIFDSENNPIGYILHSEMYSPEVYGYNGKVPLLIAVDQNNTIKEIRMLPNRETGDFVEILRKKNYLNSWDNKHPREALQMEVDAISGATETALAISKNVHIALSHFTSETKNKITQSPNQAGSKQILRYAAQFLILLFAIFSFFNPKSFRRYRPYLLILSIAVFGFWLTKMLTIADFYNWVINGINLKNSLIILLIFIVSIILPLFTSKNFYCTYICPFGCMQELCSKLPNRKLRIPITIYHHLKKIRIYFLALIIGVFLTGFTLDITQVEPFIAFKFHIASNGVLILASIFIILSIFIKRPWCNYFCPTGLILSLFELKKKNK